MRFHNTSVLLPLLHLYYDDFHLFIQVCHLKFLFNKGIVIITVTSWRRLVGILCFLFTAASSFRCTHKSSAYSVTNLLRTDRSVMVQITLNIFSIRDLMQRLLQSLLLRLRYKNNVIIL